MFLVLIDIVGWLKLTRRCNRIRLVWTLLLLWTRLMLLLILILILRNSSTGLMRRPNTVQPHVLTISWLECIEILLRLPLGLSHRWGTIVDWIVFLDNIGLLLTILLQVKLFATGKWLVFVLRLHRISGSWLRLAICIAFSVLETIIMGNRSIFLAYIKRVVCSSATNVILLIRILHYLIIFIYLDWLLQQWVACWIAPLCRVDVDV